MTTFNFFRFHFHIVLFKKNYFIFFQLRQTCLKELRGWLLDQPHLRGCCREDSTLRLDKPSVDADNFLLRWGINRTKAMQNCFISVYLVLRVPCQSGFKTESRQIRAFVIAKFCTKKLMKIILKLKYKTTFQN